MLGSVPSEGLVIVKHALRGELLLGILDEVLVPQKFHRAHGVVGDYY